MKKKCFSCRYHAGVLLAVSAFILSTTVPGFTELPLTENNESPFRLIYEKVAPSVVLIEVENETPDNQRTPYRLFERFFNVPIPQEQRQRPRSGIGSGVIIDREGHIITNNHVIANADKITVRIDETEEYKAEVIGRDPQTDLAVIKLDLDGELLPPQRVAELGDSDTLKPGDYAIAIGNPIGLERTITVGVISALGRYDLQVFGASELQFQNFIQTDAQINPGNSGGALVDINGKVIGINNMYTAQFAAIGFAIPVNIVKNVSNKLIEFGEVKRGFVGIQVPPGENSDITKEIQEAMGLDSTDGVLIPVIIVGSPAEKAGLKHGDVIVTLDSEKVKNFHNFQLKIAEYLPGDTIKLGIIQDGKSKNITLTLADRDDYQVLASAGSTNTWRGINVVGLDSQMASKYDLSGIETGVLVVKIDEESPAAEANIREGDVIIEIESTPINNVRDFNNLKNKYKDSDKTILIYRERKTSSGRNIKGYVAVKSK